MAESTNAERAMQDVPGLTTLVIPTQFAEKVVEFVEGLELDNNDEVAGYMMFGRGFGQLGGRLNETISTVTRCKDTQHGKDQMCDADTYITT